MKPSMERDISEAHEMLAKLAASLPKMSPADQVDIGARMKELSKLAENIADGWEKQVQGKKTIVQDGCKQLIRPKAKPDATRPGCFVIAGSAFQAIFSPAAQVYYDTRSLAADLPDIAERYKRTSEGERISYKGL